MNSAGVVSTQYNETSLLDCFPTAPVRDDGSAGFQHAPLGSSKDFFQFLAFQPPAATFAMPGEDLPNQHTRCRLDPPVQFHKAGLELLCKLPSDGRFSGKTHAKQRDHEQTPPPSCGTRSGSFAPVRRDESECRPSRAYTCPCGEVAPWVRTILRLPSLHCEYYYRILRLRGSFSQRFFAPSVRNLPRDGR